MLLASSSLEEQPPEVLVPLLRTLMDDDHYEVAAMVVDAMLCGTLNDTFLIGIRANLEVK